VQAVVFICEKNNHCRGIARYFFASSLSLECLEGIKKRKEDNSHDAFLFLIETHPYPCPKEVCSTEIADRIYKNDLIKNKLCKKTQRL
jgi:hypothetical protein